MLCILLCSFALPRASVACLTACMMVLPMQHCSLAGVVLLWVAHSGNLLDNEGSHVAGIVSAAICLAVLPCAATVEGLHKMDASSAALVNTCWRKRNGALPDWLQDLTSTAATTAPGLPAAFVAACSTPEYDHVLRLAIKHAPHLLQLQDANGCTALHHMLTNVVQRGHARHESAFSTLSHRLQQLLYAGVPLHLPNVENQTACEAARLAIQRHRADNPDHGRSKDAYLLRVESLLDVLEKLQAAGTSLQFLTREVDGQRQAVVSACTMQLGLRRFSWVARFHSHLFCPTPGSSRVWQE